MMDKSTHFDWLTGQSCASVAEELVSVRYGLGVPEIKFWMGDGYPRTHKQTTRKTTTTLRKGDILFFSPFAF